MSDKIETTIASIELVREYFNKAISSYKAKGFSDSVALWSDGLAHIEKATAALAECERQKETINDLAMLLRRSAHSLGVNSPLRNKITDYLFRKSLLGDITREVHQQPTGEQQ